VERIEPPAEEFDAEEVARRGVSGLLADGAALFNEGRYEEAHEEFEKVWLSNEAGDADFFKGLIQASICLHHLQRGNLDGARKLASGHRRYLAAFLPVHRGLDVEGFLAAMQRFLAPLVESSPGEAPAWGADGRPRIELGEATDA
jgi:predicted metal-dependent hydrolase